MSDVENETTETADATAEATDVTEAESASAPETAPVPTGAGVASASEQPDASASEPASTAGEPTGVARNFRKTREGVVVSNKMDKTAVIAVIERVRHPKYNKFVLQTKRLYAHDETNDVNIGDRVRLMETRPLSKNKRWRVTDVLERAK